MTLVQKLKKDGIEFPKESALIMLILYAANRVQYNDDGSMEQDEIESRLKKLEYMTEEDIEILRDRLISSTEECENFINEPKKH